MASSLTLQYVFDTIMQVLSRPAVLRQLLAIVLALLLAWFLSKRFSHLMGERLKFHVAFRQQYLPPGRLHYLIYPLVAIVVVHLVKYLFLLVGWFAGLLHDFTFVLWALLGYRLFMTSLYAVFSEENVRPYYYTLLTPFFVLFIVTLLVKQLFELNALTGIELLPSFNSTLTVGSLLLATVGLYFWVNGAWAIQNFLEKVVISRTNTAQGAVVATLTIWRYVIVAIGIIIVLSALGVDRSTMTGIAAGLAFGLSYGLRDFVGSIASGFVLLYSGSVRPGDTVKIKPLNEKVVIDKLSILATTGHSENEAEIIIPNKKLLNLPMTKQPSKDEEEKNNKPKKVKLTIGTSYESDPHQVMEILLAVAQQHKLVLKKNKKQQPTVSLREFGENSIQYQIIAKVKKKKHIKTVTNDLYLMIWQEFAKHQIKIPSPEQELPTLPLIKQEEPQKKKKPQQLTLTIAVSSDTDPAIVKEVLLAVAQQHEHVLKKNEKRLPTVSESQKSDSRQEFELSVWTKKKKLLKNPNELYLMIGEQFAQRNISLLSPSPQELEGASATEELSEQVAPASSEEPQKKKKPQQLTLTIAVSSDSDPAIVKEVLLAVAQQHEHVLKKNEKRLPRVLESPLSDSKQEFELLVWTKKKKLLERISDELYLMIGQQLAQRNIQLLSDSQESPPALAAEELSEQVAPASSEEPQKKKKPQQLSLTIAVSSDSDPAIVKEVLLAVAQQHEHVLKKNEKRLPRALESPLSDSKQEFELLVWTKKKKLLERISDELYLMIGQQLAQRNIQLLSDSQESPPALAAENAPSEGVDSSSEKKKPQQATPVLLQKIIEGNKR